MTKSNHRPWKTKISTVNRRCLHSTETLKIGQCKTKTADCGLRTADWGPEVKCRKNHIRGEIREMSSRKQCGSRWSVVPKPRDFVTHVTLVQRNGKRDWRDLTRNTCETHVMCKPFILPTRLILRIRRGRYKHGGPRVAGIFEVNLAFYWFIVTQLHSVRSILSFSEVHIRQKFHRTSEQLKSAYLDLQYFR